MKSHTLVILHNLQFVHIFGAISAKSDGERAFHPLEKSHIGYTA
nr:MAG TPA: hypothetical protein [Caudoviricetes sp.]